MTINPHVYAQFPRCLQLFIDMAHEKRFRKGDVIAYNNQNVDGFHLVIDGNLRRYGTCDQVSESDRFLDHGRDVLFEYLRRGDVVGESLLLLPGNQKIEHDSTVECMGDVQVASMGAIVLSRFRLAQPEAYAEMRDMLMEMSLYKLSLTRMLVNGMVNLDAKERIRGLLNMLSSQPDAVRHPEGIEIRMTKQDIALFVGCSREVAGRVIKDFHEGKYLYNRGKQIVIYNGSLPVEAGL